MFDCVTPIIKTEVRPLFCFLSSLACTFAEHKISKLVSGQKRQIGLLLWKERNTAYENKSVVGVCHVVDLVSLTVGETHPTNRCLYALRVDSCSTFLLSEPSSGLSRCG